MGARRALGIVLGGALLVGCSLLTSLSGLSGGVDPPDGGDASVPADVSVSDADAASDGGGDSASTPFCASMDATFCDDFDDSNEPTFAKWAFSTVDQHGFLTRVDGGVSPPHALEARMEAYSTGGNQGAHLYRYLPFVKRARVTFKVRVDVADPASGGTMLVNQIESRPDGGALAGIRLGVGGGKINFTGAIYPDGGANFGTFPDFNPKLDVDTGVWHSYDATYDFVASPATIAVDRDGQTWVTSQPIPGAAFGPAQLYIEVGIHYVRPPTSGWTVRIDDYAIFAE